MSLQAIASRLAAHCRKGDWAAAQKELYSQDAVSIEQEASPAFAKEIQGLDAIRKKGDAFNAMVEQVHSIQVGEPIFAGDAFAFTISMDLTMKGKGRTTMAEICVYTVENDKITSEQFFF